MSRLARLVSAACLPLLIVSCVIAPKNPENSPDGLVRVQSKNVDSLFIMPGMSLSKYRRVMFDKVSCPLLSRPYFASTGAIFGVEMYGPDT